MQKTGAECLPQKHDLPRLNLGLSRARQQSFATDSWDWDVDQSCIWRGSYPVYRFELYRKDLQDSSDSN